MPQAAFASTFVVDHEVLGVLELSVLVYNTVGVLLGARDRVRRSTAHQTAVGIGGAFTLQLVVLLLVLASLFHPFLRLLLANLMRDSRLSSLRLLRLAERLALATVE